MHNGCVLWGGVGTGKTFTALAYALLREAGKHIVVVTTAKKRDTGDWEHEAALLGVPFDGIEVTSWNKIGAYIDREDLFFIFDEQRLVGTGAWVKHFYKIAKKNHWILLSATPGDTWSDYAPMFIANGWYKNITEFRNTHAVYSRYTTFPKIERYIGEGRLVKYRDALLVEMPMERHTKRHFHYVDVAYNKDTLDLVRKKRWNVFEDKPLKNASELFGVMRKVVSTDSSRLNALGDLIKEHKKLIVFYNYNYELDMMRELLTEISALSTHGFMGHTGQMSTSPVIEKQWTQEASGLIIPKSELSSNTTTDKKLLLPSTSLIVPSSLETNQQNPKESSLQTISNSPQDSMISLSMDQKRNYSGNEPTQIEQSAESQRFVKPHTALSSTPSSTITTPTNGSSSNTESKIITGESNITMPQSVDVGGSFGWAEWNGHKHEPIPDTDRWVYLVQYASGSEGWNCIETDAMAFWSLTYSWKQFEQAQGRIDRVNTPFTDLHYYVMLSDSMAEKPVIASLNKKRDFQPK